MNSGFEFEMNGIKFPNSESAYICGMFSNNDEHHISIQRQLIAETNGYLAKKSIRKENTKWKRTDWEEYNVEWMLYVVWNKVNSNKEFRDVLMPIPEGATIIENCTFQKVSNLDTSAFWGCRNDRIKVFSKLVKQYVGSLYLDTDTEVDRVTTEYLNDFCNFGVFVGNNTMGKILMIVKDRLHNGTEPEIDYDLLNRKNIHLLGKLLIFDK